DAVQRVDVGGRHQVGAGRERLAELDEGRPQHLEVGGEGLGLGHFGHGAGGRLHRRRRAPVHPGKDAAMAREAADDLGGAGEAAAGFWQGGVSASTAWPAPGAPWAEYWRACVSEASVAKATVAVP